MTRANALGQRPNAGKAAIGGYCAVRSASRASRRVAIQAEIRFMAKGEMVSSIVPYSSGDPVFASWKR